MSDVFNAFFASPVERGGRPVGFPGLNEVIAANRSNPLLGARLKRRLTDSIAKAARAAVLRQGWDAPDGPVDIELSWVEANRRRDQDNVTSAQKFLLDGLVEAGVLHGDGQRWIPQPPRQRIVHDPGCPGVWVRITRCEGETDD